MDQKRVTTRAILGELDGRGVKFATLRMRSPGLLKRINTLAASDYKTVALNRPGPHNPPRAHESAAVKLTSYPGIVRQLIVTGLGRDAPFPVTAKNAFKSKATARSVFGRHRPATNSRYRSTSCSPRRYRTWPDPDKLRTRCGSCPYQHPPSPARKDPAATRITVY